MSRKFYALASIPLLAGLIAVPILVDGGSAFALVHRNKVYINNSQDVEGSAKVNFSCAVFHSNPGQNNWTLSMTKLNITDASGVSLLTGIPLSSAIVINLGNGSFVTTAAISQNTTTGQWQVSASGFLSNAASCYSTAPVKIYNAGANPNLLNFSGQLP